MELAAYEVGMIGQFDHFHVSPVGSRAGDPHPARSQSLFVFTIKFVPMAMAFADLEFAINLMRQGSGLDLTGPCSQAHGSTQFLHSPKFAQLVDHAVGCGGIEFAGI